MKILHVLLTTMEIPPQKYGGTERVIWGLIEGQEHLGHDVRVLVKKKHHQRRNIIELNPEIPLPQQIEGWADVIHFHHPEHYDIDTPYVCTQHSNADKAITYPINTIFLSSKHAAIHQGECFVHNGLDWRLYGEPNVDNAKPYVHFLGKASWRTKNVQGAIHIARQAGRHIHVLGGKRFCLKRNPYAYFGRDVHFHGMVGGERKNHLIRHSSALLFPVLWHEPFGLAITESLYLGCPVIATPFGSLPDIINNPQLGLLSDHYQELIDATKNIQQFDRKACHHHAKTQFDHITMSARYVECYERVLSGETLNRKCPQATTNLKTHLTIYD